MCVNIYIVLRANIRYLFKYKRGGTVQYNIVLKNRYNNNVIIYYCNNIQLSSVDLSRLSAGVRRAVDTRNWSNGGGGTNTSTTTSVAARAARLRELTARGALMLRQRRRRRWRARAAAAARPDHSLPRR